MMTLDQVPPGARCRIASLAGPPALVQRLLELGLMEGEELTVITRAPLGDTEFRVIDLPGTYSLAPRSPDEMVSVDLLLGHVEGQGRPDVILSIVDASNLERHLYLTTQLMDLGVPVVVAANLTDVAKNHGLSIDFATLSQRLGVPVVPIQANHGLGLEELKQAVVRAADAGQAPPEVPFPDVFR